MVTLPPVPASFNTYVLTAPQYSDVSASFHTMITGDTKHGNLSTDEEK